MVLKREEYIQTGETRRETDNRTELQHMRQDSDGFDFTNPAIAESTLPGKSRRTTVLGPSPIENGPLAKNGKRKGWYVLLDHLGETVLMSVETSDELRNLPQDAITAQQYCNLLAAENPVLAGEIIGALSEVPHHTAHHTTASDVGERVSALFKQAQLSMITYQDRRIGQGVIVPPIKHHALSPETVIGTDNVPWNA